MNEVDLVKLENLRREQMADDKVFRERVERLSKVSYFTDKPKGIFTKRCPKCNAKLKKDSRTYAWTLAFIIDTLYTCSCGYEYGIEQFDA